ncbi:MAG: two-component system chemotaxis response regulator CheY [Paraglaciecola sp.]|jgi:two-component system chemotaxis response regulator CheY
MFTVSEIKQLLSQLGEDITAIQSHITDTTIEDAEHSCLENKLIVLGGIKRKLAIKLEQELSMQGEHVKQPRVLVVDDSEATREVIRCYLNQMGFEHVDLAADGVEAWQKMQFQLGVNAAYGLVISDWLMPKMSGIELLKQIKDDKGLGHTPVYLITANREKEFIMTAIKQGVSGYLVKPFNFDHIKEKFFKYL